MQEPDYEHQHQAFATFVIKLDAAPLRRLGLTHPNRENAGLIHQNLGLRRAFWTNQRWIGKGMREDHKLVSKASVGLPEFAEDASLFTIRPS
jgi:hypothetical protein